jgi:hypothetical protein
MKLFPRQLGRTKVPYGQFYGGLSGWEGLGALGLDIRERVLGAIWFMKVNPLTHGGAIPPHPYPLPVGGGRETPSIDETAHHARIAGL